MKFTIIIMGLLLGALILPACGSGETTTAAVEGREITVTGGSYQDITVTELKTMMGDKDFVLVNVHVPYAGEIPGTDSFVPYNEIEPNISRLPQDKGAKIVVYCRSGYMSGIAAETLVKQGFTNVWNMEGGMSEWEKQGNKLSQSSR